MWDAIGRSEGVLAEHESLRCVYSVLGQITLTQVRRLDAAAVARHQECVALHKTLNPNRSGRRKRAEAQEVQSIQGGKGAEESTDAPAVETVAVTGAGERRRISELPGVDLPGVQRDASEGSPVHGTLRESGAGLQRSLSNSAAGLRGQSQLLGRSSSLELGQARAASAWRASKCVARQGEGRCSCQSSSDKYARV